MPDAMQLRRNHFITLIATLGVNKICSQGTYFEGQITSSGHSLNARIRKRYQIASGLSPFNIKVHVKLMLSKLDIAILAESEERLNLDQVLPTCQAQPIASHSGYLGGGKKHKCVGFKQT